MSNDNGYSLLKTYLSCVDLRNNMDCTPAVRQIGLGQLARVYGF
jgi:hypothetical protein